ncbi:MAG: tetratricopeptide repeat protein, partial [Cyclobacteriaceae bacterium]|nr:tetratricopeptide repeat protein [Cyclobacteriaceae bacterium]
MKKIFICSILLGLLGCSGLDKTMQLGDYNKIINRYSGSINKNDPELNFTVAEAYRKSNRIQEAVPFYKSALDHSYDEKYLAYYYARSLKANKQYDEARNVLQIHLEKTNETDVKKIMANEIQNLSSIEDLKKKETYFREKNLDAINTPFTEFGPVYNNGFLYFTSNREASKIYKATGTPFLDIYRVPTKGANVNLSLLEMLDPVINSPDINEGSVAFSADGLSLIYAKGNNGKATGNKEVNLYFTRYRNGQWLEPRPISVNDPESWDSTPSMSPDGQTLYFSSNRPGGFGGTDLYSAKLNRRGRWVDIRNLGPEINTPGDEMFPFISADGSLFFASDGHPGLGKLDIFRASRTSGLAQIENLGMPMNSEADDFGYFEFDLTRGFFSSNRKEGNGDDDIYTFINDDPNLKIVNYYLAGSTVTENDGGEEIIVSNSKVTLVSRDGTVLDETYTREDGQFRFRVYTEE